MPHIGEVQVDSHLLSPILSYRAVYHNPAHKFIENGGVKFRNIQLHLHKLQKLVHIGTLPGLCFNFPFQYSGKLLNLRLLLLVLTG